MTLHALEGFAPRLADPDRVFIAADAQLIGQVALGLDVSVWFGAVLRGDNAPIAIGDGSNIQDGAVLHVDPGRPVRIGRFVTVGHRAIVHGAEIGDTSLVGMGAVLLNGSVIGRDCLVGAGALVTEGKAFPDGSLILGAPARRVRALSATEIEGLRQSACRYVENGRRYRAGLRPAPG